MIQRISRRKYRVFAFDIESHNDDESIEKGETSMWLGSFIDENSKIDDEDSCLYNMDEFLSKLETLSSAKRGKDHNESRPIKNICIYIYNLSFEWSFILPYLEKWGFHFKERINAEDEFVFNSVSTKSCSSVWMCQLKFGKKCGTILIRDLAKIFGGGLGAVAKSFNLQTQKGEIDYRKNRLHNYQVTKEEKEYCFKDTRILVDILLAMQEKNDKDFWNSSSMASYSMRKLLKRGYPRSLKPYAKYRQDYPELNQEETDFLRKGVGGGITYAPRNWQFKEINQKVGHIDKHQMHPSSAFFNLFPYGEGTYFKGKPPIGYISACRIRISYDDVKLHSVISLIGIPFIEDRELVVWNFEIPTMMKCYVNLRIEYIDGYYYKSKPLPWRRYYEDNYRKRLIAKRDGDKFNILFYKLLNNSSYGKHLEKPHNQIFENYVDSFGIIDSKIVDKEEIEVNAKYTYLPVGSCIPAYSRVDLIETALTFGWENIVYFDTDSIFFIWNEQTAKAWSKLNQEDFLGGWGWEEMIDRSQFTAPKRYKVEVEGKTTIKSGGINFDEYILRTHTEEVERYESQGLTHKEAISKVDVEFDEINIVSSSWKVQRAYRVKGGTIIQFQEKKMSIQDKYIEVYNKNANI